MFTNIQLVQAVCFLVYRIMFWVWLPSGAQDFSWMEITSLYYTVANMKTIKYILLIELTWIKDWICNNEIWNFFKLVKEKTT